MKGKFLYRGQRRFIGRTRPADKSALATINRALLVCQASFEQSNQGNPLWLPGRAAWPGQPQGIARTIHDTMLAYQMKFDKLLR